MEKELTVPTALPSSRSLAAPFQRLNNQQRTVNGWEREGTLSLEFHLLSGSEKVQGIPLISPDESRVPDAARQPKLLL